jgi:hypothetical protein
MSKVLKLPTFTDRFGLKNLPPSVINKGSLVLINPAASWGPGVPAVSVPNMAGDAAAALGINARTLSVVNSVTAPNLVERTSKGGIHAAWKRGDPANTAAQSFGLESQTIRDYIEAHRSDGLYIGAAGILTRDSATATPSSSNRLGGWIVSSSNDVAAIRLSTSTISPLPTTNRTLSVTAARSVGRFLVGGAWSSLSGVMGPSQNVVLHYSGGAGAPGHSWVTHAFYVENLKESGQTAAQAHDKFAAYVAPFYAPGGLYDGDVYTNPATL